MKKLSIFLLCAVSLFCSCSDDDDTYKRGYIELSSLEKEIAQQSKSFAFNLLNAVNDNTDDNSQVLVSPLSASFALSMAMNGASGETLNEFVDVLGFSGYSAGEINTFNRKLLGGLNRLDNSVKIEVSNSLWLNSGFSVLDSYRNAVKSDYKAQLQQVDFAQPSTLDAINSWCSRNTGGLVNNMLDYLSPDNMFLLINTLYFKAPWAAPFTTVKQGAFTTITGEEQTVDFMTGEQNARYYQSDRYTAAAITYGNGAFCYYVVLPNEGIDADECIDELAAGSWSDYRDYYYGIVNLKLSMPKFEISSKRYLASPLMGMGLNAAFLPGADLSNMTSIPTTHISNVLQGVVFKVDEMGAEAASATVITGDVAAPPPMNVELTVDRPFLFFVQEQSSGAILFAGKVGRI